MEADDKLNGLTFFMRFSLKMIVWINESISRKFISNGKWMEMQMWFHKRQ